jgi:hypothetical protein
MMSPHTPSITAAVGAAITGAVAPALMFLGAGTAQAVQDISEHGAVAIIDNLPTTPRDCGSCFNPQPDPPGFPDPTSRSPLIGNPNEASLGGPDTGPSPSPARTGQ